MRTAGGSWLARRSFSVERFEQHRGLIPSTILQTRNVGHEYVFL
jgi:hypothetical protein